MQVLPTELYSAQQARNIDRIVQEHDSITGFELMAKAADASFQVIREHYLHVATLFVFCGAGNNGGDGYLIAMLALRAGYCIQLYSIVSEDQLKGDAKQACCAFLQAGGVISTSLKEISPDSSGIIVDALLGTGVNRLVTGQMAQVIHYINSLDVPVFAIDMPSGLNADTGNSMGCALHAHITLTFIVLKRGLFTGLAQDYCGLLLYSGLEVSQSIIDLESSQESLLSLPKLIKRRPSAHKGEFGHVLVVGGDYGYAGAAYLAAEAALNTGAGLVSIATRQEHALQVHLLSPELMGYALDKVQDITDLLLKVTVLVLGPGLAQREWAKRIWSTLVRLDKPRVIDADALNLLAKTPSYSEQWILTPHPGEAARLLECSVVDILENRYAAVRAIQQKYGGVCVLKGAGSLVCAGERVFVNPTGNPGMASGGMGDVLAGMIASFLAQKYSLLESAMMGVYLHGLAADKAVIGRGERGLRASEVLNFLREVVN